MMAPIQDDDSALVSRAQRGDFEAFSALVDKYSTRVYTLALRIVGRPEDAQEVVQETFLGVIEHIQSFRGESQFATWLMRIAANHGLKLLRKRKRTVTTSYQDPGDSQSFGDLPHPHYIAEWSETPEQIANRRETRAILDEAIEQLDEKHRSVFLLRDVEGLSTRETAEALGLTESNVKVRLLRARLALREQLTRRFGDDSTRVEASHEHDEG